MRLVSALALALVGLATPALAAINIPTCGITCLFGDTITKSECHSFANTTCLCTNQQVIAELGACVLEKCSVRDALSMQKFSDETCGKVMVDKSGPARIVPPIFGALAVLLFVIRIVARFTSGKRSWGADDWAIVPAVVAMIALVVLCGFLANDGLGIDMWYLDPDRITYLLRTFFWGEVLYVFIIPVTKISVLIFYLQIFPERFYRRATMTLIVLNACYLVAFLLTTVLQCTPVEGAWLTWDGTYHAECRSLNKQVWAAALTGIILDVAMLVLPMPALWKLKMSIRKKLQVMFMFSLGIFVTIVSAVRLQYIVAFATTRNPTQDFVPVGIWSVVEVSVSIICACLPALRSLLALAMPKSFGTTHKSGKTSEYTSGMRSNAQSNVQSSRIRVKSEFTVQSRRPEDEDSSIELILQRPQSDLRMAGEAQAADTQGRLERDIENAVSAASAYGHGQRSGGGGDDRRGSAYS